MLFRLSILPERINSRSGGPVIEQLNLYPPIRTANPRDGQLGCVRHMNCEQTLVCQSLRGSGARETSCS